MSDPLARLRGQAALVPRARVRASANTAIRRTRERLRGSRLVRAVRSLPVVLSHAVWVAVTRPRSDRFLFLSDSHTGFSGNFGLLRDELRRQHPRAQIIGVFKSSLMARRTLRDALRLPYLLATSGTIILDDFYPLVYPLRIRRGVKLVQVWHAAGAFKRVGHSRAGLPGGPTPGSRIHRNYTHAVVSSESIRGDYADAFGIDVARVHALGVPRTDVLFDEAAIRATRAQVRAALDVADDERLVLFAPTFRGNGQLTATTDETADWGLLAEQLGEGHRVVVRRHPFTTATAPPLPDGVIDGSAGEMNDLLTAVDVLVTDYSSSIFEFALLRRPVVFFVPDLEEYTERRSFYRPFDHYAIGPVVHSPEDLVDAIRSAAPSGDRFDRFLDEFCGALDGRSTERIVRDLLLAAPTADATRGAGRTRAFGDARTSRASTHADGAMWPRLLFAYLARASLALVYAPLKLLPSRRKVVMISREHSSAPEDFLDLRDAIRSMDPEVQVVMLVRMLPPGFVAKIAYAFHMIAQLYHVATAQVLVVDTYAIVASVLRHKQSLTVIQIWHALGAFKKFGLSILGQQEGRDARLAKAMRMHERYDIVVASSQDARAPFAEALNTPSDKVHVIPLPRVDRLRDPVLSADIRSRIYSERPELRDRPIAVFAPTFRLDGGVAVDLSALAQALRAIGIHTIVKLHPLMTGRSDPTIDTAPGLTTQEVLRVADFLITDYSSAVYEAAALGVPTYFLTPDLDDYDSSRSFYLDFPQDLPGPVAAGIPALIDALQRRAATREQAEAFARRWIEVPDPLDAVTTSQPCTDALSRLVLQYVGRPPA